MFINAEFKETFANRTIVLQFDSYLTVTQFIEDAKQRLKTRYGDDVDIIDANIYLNDGRIPEEREPLQPNETIIFDYWYGRFPFMQNLAFYMRRKDMSYPQIDFIKAQRQQQRQQRQYKKDDCPICLEHTSVFNAYSCSHSVCDTCFENCNKVNIRCCSICRAK
jgi:hypothetical protein